MRGNRRSVFIHLVWATWDRLPLITPGIERRLYRTMQATVEGLGCTVLALNGVEDHVHVFVSLPSTVDLAHLMKQVKGVSSHFVNQTLRPSSPFKWQGGYGAFSVSRWDVEMIIGYIRRQKEHHGRADLRPELEE
ncbi:IS200/IS605 family transposase, partial [Oscillochloris sp. ZM17-4]|uniref:IS200/IS605 family transposase n=1 Tax=Oscillochloris sp. ZM17-4 TaxID=2866714 RepID=UPI001C72BE30